MGEALEPHTADEGRWERIMEYARRVEAEPSLLGVSAHVIAVSRR